MSEIKVGDLVMVVKPPACCGKSNYLGFPFVALSVAIHNLECEACGFIFQDLAAQDSGGYFTPLRRLKKIDPPSEGDSFPTRKELEVKA